MIIVEYFSPAGTMPEDGAFDLFFKAISNDVFSLSEADALRNAILMDDGFDPQPETAYELYIKRSQIMSAQPCVQDTFKIVSAIELYPTELGGYFYEIEKD